MHIEHLRELAVTIVGLLNKDPSKTKYLGLQIKTLCSSILRDCCIEMATSKKDLDLAASTENCARLLESYRQIRQIPGEQLRMYISTDASKGLKHLNRSSPFPYLAA